MGKGVGWALGAWGALGGPGGALGEPPGPPGPWALALGLFPSLLVSVRGSAKHCLH